MTKTQRSNEVSVRAAITESSLSVNVRSRAIAAFDRLLGGFIGIPAAWLEQIEARIQDRTARESVIQDAAASRIQRAILNDEEVSRILADIALSSRLAPIANKVRVAGLAVDELLGQANKEEPEASEEKPGNLDEDWLNHFSAHSEKASSEGVRRLWAKVLAGEIRQTGSFSLSSLRLLSELDQRMAATFQREVHYRVEDTYILKPELEEMRSARLESLALLEEVGLIHSIDAVGGIAKAITPGIDRMGLLREQDLLLVMEMSGPIALKIIPLTRAGCEIVRILPPVDALAVLERVGKAITSRVISLEIRRVLDTTERGIITKSIKVLKKREG